ncbi:DEAD/DEAH box helicase [Sneathiella chinensis]|uniref:DEAD/DEAH box helicase n=1 Tax=Sneathiella chinensis TaxID=349750 RepID=UPI001469BAEF|nr:DEAD/DEAH box helicase [Sneathiella chinensis]
MKQFDDLGLAESLLQALTAEGYTTPTPIQLKVIPAMLAGKDVIGIAQTGTGKTASFVLPILQRIDEQKIKPVAKSCTGLIVTPTRELASQIADNIRKYSRHQRVSVAVVVGGVKPGPQIRDLARGVDILVATPGRLLDHMNTGAVRLDKTTCIVLDEADQMLDLGFLPGIRKLMGKLPAERQTVLMSATMPTQIRKLGKDFQSNPEEISVAPVSRPIERIEQSVILVDRSDKRRVLTDILSGSEVARAIVFTRTKRGADKVSQHLEKAGLVSAAIHGNKSQNQRNRALDGFRSGDTPILVATDIAARGIDIDDVSHVVNFDLPNVAESYVHRIGRTARAGRTGIAVSLCDVEEQSLLRDIEKLTGNTLPRSGGFSDQPAAADKPTPGSRRGPKKGASTGEESGGKPAEGKAPQRKSRPKPKAKTGKPANNGQRADGRKVAGDAPRNGSKGPSKTAAKNNGGNRKRQPRKASSDTSKDGLVRMLGGAGRTPVRSGA